MDLDEEILSDFSDSEIVDSKHKSLVETISSLDKKARLKPASRKEPSLQISEYHLVNKADEEKGKKNLVDVQSLVKSLKKKPSNVHIAKKITAVHDARKNLTLPKPLEKIHSDKIEREVAFENVKEDISKWDPIVFDNRTSDQLKFPLKQIDKESVEDEQKKDKSHHKFLNTFKKPNSLELALAKLLDSSQVVTQYREEKERREQEIRERREKNKNAEFKLTLNEMKEKQKEFIKLRAQKAFKEKKAWMQNKIKSKKYHRLMKREKVKEKLKEFEKLQKTDPEAALEQLDLLDKTRAEERISLRHKSTGQWAKNLQVRAKYDKESRIALAEQLSQSRALSQKVKRDSSESEGDEDSGVEQDGDNEDNPWMKSEIDNNVDKYFSGYRKYWDEKEKEKGEGGVEYGSVSLEKLAGTLADIGDDYEMPVFIESSIKSKSNNAQNTSGTSSNDEKEDAKENGNTTNDEDRFEENKKTKKRNRKRKSVNNIENILNRSGAWTVIPVDNDEVEYEDKSGKKHKNDNEVPIVNGKEIKTKIGLAAKHNNEHERNKPNAENCDTDNITPTKKQKKKRKQKDAGKLDLSTDLAIDEAFDSLESTWKDQVKQQVEVLAKTLTEQGRSDGGKKKAKNERFDFNDRKKSKKFVELDEELNETHKMNETEEEQSLKQISQLSKEALKSSTDKGKIQVVTGSKPSSDLEQIDPNQFLKVDRNANRMLGKKMPQILQEGAMDDEEEEGNESEGEEGDVQQMTIEEAFADDDVVQEFKQDKEAEGKKTNTGDIDLTLPGWGDWGGAGISKKVSKRKKRRFIIKGVKLPRKDETKPIVIINEDTAPDLKKHLVDGVPHPFTSVKEYEASLRTPLGREWVPELAHRTLTQPAIRTKLGAVIQPIDYESVTQSKLKEYR
uniref:U3 small nucleolar RNA-associated protein 14 homolog A n=1 Tax=Cacopsylla melanoneura TaxID=428564 RepID=A0A8D8UWS9_9HEMI